jgi:hypothetical protein
MDFWTTYHNWAMGQAEAQIRQHRYPRHDAPAPHTTTQHARPSDGLRALWFGWLRRPALAKR